MGANAKTVKRRTGLVYAGAAFLIVVVGLRTTLQTAEEGFNAMSYITLGALALEFILLLLYALTIATAEDDHQVIDTSAITDSFKDINVDFTPLVNQLDELQKSNEKLLASIEANASKQSESTQVIADYANNVAKIGDGIESIVNDEVNRKVQDAISSLIASNIKQ